MGTLSSRGCLDCRVDAGIALPRVTSGPEGVYFLWDRYVARVSDGRLPGPGGWLRIEDDPDVEHVDYTDWASAGGRLVLVGRGGTIAQQALVVSTLSTDVFRP